MKKILAVLLLLASVFALASCGGEDETPEGMQLVYGGVTEGYYFYAPEEWLISNVGRIKSAYISRVNTTSISFAEIELDGHEDKRAYFFGEYFTDSLDEFPTEPTILTNGESATFGTGDYAADEAKKYVYTYTYRDASYTGTEDEPIGYTEAELCFMQILVREGERYFIFTYSALAAAEEGEDSNYTKYLEKAQSAIDNFRFVGAGEKPEYDDSEFVRDGDGFLLITDKDVAGFEFYVPQDFKYDFGSAIISATHDDGSNVTMTKATGTGVSAELYWEKRKAELEAITDGLTEIEIAKEAELGNASSPLYGDWCWSYEYTYVYNGTEYRVYQILALDGSDGYVFTYTARSENYEKHIDNIEKIIEKVKF